MDELHVHQFWGISPCLNLLAAAANSAAAAQSIGCTDAEALPTAFLQVCYIIQQLAQLACHSFNTFRLTACSLEMHCPSNWITLNLQICPYDCRHTLATICGYHSRQPAPVEDVSTPAPCPAISAPASTPAAAPPASAALSPHHQLRLYIYESEPEALARHMLLLSVLLDGHLRVKDRVEMFLELHGNVMLRQKTADYLGEAYSITWQGHCISYQFCKHALLQVQSFHDSSCDVFPLGKCLVY